MSKQIKLGFDKVPAPKTTQYPILIDIQGEKLTDAAGNFIVTEEDGVESSFLRKDSALSTSINNAGVEEAISVEEQFPVESEVSTTLLGVTRAEEQLSLFADVSTYGVDPDNWNYYSYDPNTGPPFEWFTRKNLIYGKRYQPSFFENTQEQALYLSGFPVQYNYPRGPFSSDTPNAQPTTLHRRYMNFLSVGKFLYLKFISISPEFCKRNLLNEDIRIVSSNETEIPITLLDFIQNGSQSIFTNQGLYHDVVYEGDIQLAFNQIENFTQFWSRIVDGRAEFPELQGSQIAQYEQTAEYKALRSYAIQQTRPGGSSSSERFSVLESKSSFRYQPGRASGFTFGVRCKTDFGSTFNFVEWGCANSTDQYMFQLKGPQFQIIRRSVIPLPAQLLERMGLTADDQKQVFPTDIDSSETLFETVIPRSKWNGDSLDGTGRSGYIISFEDVTMYKIEFSWYGAIGAKFYAYVPTGVGEARWVLLHTLVIENGLGKPIMKNPDLKFKYLIYTNETSRLNEPIYIYKYGASYYIDGGDEGTLRSSSETAPSKEVTQRTALLGIQPKNDILNSDGIPVKNFAKAYPETLSVSSDQPVRLDIETILGSSDAVHYYDSVSLVNDRNEFSPLIEFTISEDGETYQAIGNTVFVPEYDNAKLVADGFFNMYFGYESANTGRVLRRNRDALRDLDERAASRNIELLDGTVVNTRGSDFEARISNYSSIVASTDELRSSRFKIHFLNPTTGYQESPRTYKDFAITVTPFTPAISNNELLFDGNEFNLYQTPYVEFSPYTVMRRPNLGTEFREGLTPIGQPLEVDYRLPVPKGDYSGVISSINGSVDLITYDIDLITPGTGDFAGQFRVVFSSSAPNVSETELGLAEIGINGAPTGIVFTSVPVFDQSLGKFAAYLSADPGATALTSGIQARVLTLSSAWKLDSFTSEGNDRFEYHRWSRSKILSFDVFPLYAVFALHNNSEVHNIVIEEILPTGSRVFVPNFITDSSTVDIVNASDLTPSNFNSVSRLSPILYDTSTTLSLRPSEEVLASYFVGAGETSQINLSNIFSIDRKAITPGILNNLGYFVTASTVGAANTANVEISITTKEQ